MKKEYRLQALLLAGCLLAAGLIAERLYFRLDTTEAQTYSLSSYTKTLLDGLDNTLTVTWFRSHNIDGVVPSLQYMESMLDEYARYAPEHCRIIQKNSASLSPQELAALGFAPRQFERYGSTSRITQNLYSGLLCEYRGEQRVIPFIADVQMLEADIARFITEMSQDAEHRNAERSVYVLMPPENGSGQYKYVLPWLEYAGFIPFLPPFTELKPEIPLLVIGSSYLEPADLAMIEVFLQRNGNAAFFVSGNTVAVQGDWQTEPKKDDALLALLFRLGCTVEQNLIIDPVNFRMKLPSQKTGVYDAINYPFWPTVFYGNEYQPVPQSESATQPLLPPFMPAGNPLQFFWPSELVLTDTAERRTQSVVLSSPHSIVQNAPYNTDPYGQQLKGLASNQQFAAVIAGISIPRITAGNSPSEAVQQEMTANSTTQKGRVFVAADEYCLSTAVEYTNSDSNLNFMVNVLHWLAGQDALLQLKTKQSAVFPFRYIESEEGFMQIARVSRIVNLIVIPLMLIAVGSVIILKRRRV